MLTYFTIVLSLIIDTQSTFNMNKLNQFKLTHMRTLYIRMEIFGIFRNDLRILYRGGG